MPFEKQNEYITNEDIKNDDELMPFEIDLLK